MARLVIEADEAKVIILSDSWCDARYAPPRVAGDFSLHHYLIREGLIHAVSLVLATVRLAVASVCAAVGLRATVLSVRQRSNDRRHIREGCDGHDHKKPARIREGGLAG